MDSIGTMAYSYLKSLFKSDELNKKDKESIYRVMTIMEKRGDNTIDETEWNDSNENNY